MQFNFLSKINNTQKEYTNAQRLITELQKEGYIIKINKYNFQLCNASSIIYSCNGEEKEIKDNIYGYEELQKWLLDIHSKNKNLLKDENIDIELE